MRKGSDTLKDVLTGSFEYRLHVDVFHGANRVLRELPVVGSSLKWDYSTIGFSGSLDVVIQPDDGASVIPNGLNGLLSPHSGARVLLLGEVRAGAFREVIQLGWARIVAYNNALDSHYDFGGQKVVTATELTLELQGIEVDQVRNSFLGPSQPPAGASCYGELRRITWLPVVETLPDKLAPALTYEAKQGGRWDACLELGKHLGGVLYVDSSGALTVHNPNPPVTTVLTVGEGGTILDVGQAADTDNAYNCVVGNFEDAAGNPIYAVAEVTEGPLRVNGPYGRYTRYYSSDFVKTQAAANDAVKSILQQYTHGDTYEVPVSTVINPLVEVGDKVTARSELREVTGIVTSVSHGDVDMSLVLEVPRVW